jgi:hypothetical protein
LKGWWGGKKYSDFGERKKINILTLVLSEIKFLNETKNHTPPPPKSEYFFQQHWESEYFFRKKTITPPAS